METIVLRRLSDEEKAEIRKMVLSSRPVLRPLEKREENEQKA